MSKPDRYELKAVEEALGNSSKGIIARFSGRRSADLHRTALVVLSRVHRTFSKEIAR